MIRIAVLVLTFLIKLRCRNQDIFNFIRDRYDENALRTFKSYLKISRKLLKAELDLDFLTKCKVYNIFPKFLRFKLYKKCLQSSNYYRSWQCKLLCNEIQFKRRTIRNLNSTLETEGFCA